MELLWWGIDTQEKTWRVNEPVPCGFLRIYQILSGNVLYIDENGSHKLHVGQCYILPSHTAYRLEHDARMPFRCVWLHVNAPAYIAQKLICVDTSQRTMCYHLFSCLRQLVEQGDEDNILHCIALILSQLALQGQLQAVSTAYLPTLESLCAVVQTDLQIHDFAQSLGYSAEHFNRQFKREMAQTPYKFVLQQKMQRARQLLRQGCPSKQVCHDIGYGDLKNFEKAFKTRHGMPSGAYQEHANNTK